MKTSARNAVLNMLSTRFEANVSRHKGITWKAVLARLNAHLSAFDILQQMEASGGEPDVIGEDKKSGQILFCDCSAQSPAGRRNLCYDDAALKARKANKPKGSAVAVAHAMGVELLSEEQYRALQQLGEFDTKTSSWILTTPEVRAKGGALFCDRRYGQVFLYHNGAESYYSMRGFRGLLRV